MQLENIYMWKCFFQRSCYGIIFEREENTCRTLLFFFLKVPILEFIQKLRVNQVSAFGGSPLQQRFRNFPVAAAVQWPCKITLKPWGIEDTDLGSNADHGLLHGN